MSEVCPDCDSADWAGIRCYGDGHASPTGPCEWFALCDNDATMWEPHPILGAVPICERCNSLR